MDPKINEEEEEEEEEDESFYSPEKMDEEDDGLLCSNELSDEVKKKIGDLRAILEKHDPASKDVDDLTLRRFLVARDLDVGKASSMFLKYVRWRRSFVPNGSIPESEITNQIEHNKVFMQGIDKRGCPVSVIFGARHFPSKQGTDGLRRYAVFALDKLCSRVPNGQEKFIIIVDLEGYGYSNTDVRGYIAILSILQEYYPERLRKMFIVHAPYIFMTAWKLVYPFIDKNTKKKVAHVANFRPDTPKLVSSKDQIIFVENKRIGATLLDEIDESQLPQIYGGKLQLVPIQDG